MLLDLCAFCHELGHAVSMAKHSSIEKLLVLLNIATRFVVLPMLIIGIIRRWSFLNSALKVVGQLLLIKAIMTYVCESRASQFAVEELGRNSDIQIIRSFLYYAGMTQSIMDFVFFLALWSISKI